MRIPRKLNKGQQLAILAGGEGGAQYNGTTRDGDRMVSGGGGGASCVMIWHTVNSCMCAPWKGVPWGEGRQLVLPLTNH